MADQNNSTSAVSFSVHLWNNCFFFLVSYSNTSDHSHSAHSHSRKEQENAPNSQSVMDLPVFALQKCALISSRCSLLTGQFAQWRGHGKSYCVGVRRFMIEAWLFVLAHRARLPNTADLSCTIYLAYLHIFVRRGRRSNTDI